VSRAAVPVALIAALAVCLLVSCSGSDGETPAGGSGGPAGTGLAADPLPESEFQPLFNGENLDGWEGDAELWSVRDGMIVGESPGIDHNAFLVAKEEYGDFELRLEFRLVGGEGNSGVQFRSRQQPDSPQVEGFQADIGPKYFGCLYDEARRDVMLAPAPKSLSKVLKPDGWNDYRIRAVGDGVTLTLNGLQTVDYTEPEEEIPRTGILALQVHSGPPMTIEFRNLRIARIASPAEG
jgi:hypothetical protein